MEGRDHVSDAHAAPSEAAAAPEKKGFEFPGTMTVLVTIGRI